MIFRVALRTAGWRYPPLWSPPQTPIESVLRFWVYHDLQTVLPLLSGR